MMKKSIVLISLLLLGASALFGLNLQEKLAKYLNQTVEIQVRDVTVSESISGYTKTNHVILKGTLVEVGDGYVVVSGARYAYRHTGGGSLGYSNTSDVALDNPYTPICLIIPISEIIYFQSATNRN